MIVSLQKREPLESFNLLLKNADVLMRAEARNNPYYFLKQDASKFERDIFDCFVKASKKTPFEGSLELISGHKFPDIVINKYYGVEVKTTKQDHWKSTGNSIFETTRVEDVEKIFIYFAKLSNPIDFKFRRYQECLSDIAVTHSPRYLIDMNLPLGESIFDRMGIDYDVLRKMDNPVKPFVDFIRKNLSPGEEPWWMGADDQVVQPTVQLFGNLSALDKNKLVVEAMVLFPEIFGRSSSKYHRVSTWLAARYGVVNPSMRDSFTAGGVVEIELGKNLYKKVPRIFKNLSDNIENVLCLLESLPKDELAYYWGEQKVDERPLDFWIKLFLKHSAEVMPENKKFLVNLIGYNYPEPKPQFLLEKEVEYGLSLC